MWIPVLSPAEELPRLGPAGTMCYLLAQSVLPMLLASFLSLSRLPVYLPYGAGPRLFGISPVLDQRIAGAVMGAGGLVLGLMGVVVWVRGARSEPSPTPSKTAGPGASVVVERR
ncbi:MAG: cytochrome c oxidase assembly protein [Actinobacteria bacterium]|nr:cytochrome c oxidase assembly protein [Actinomycetota bacterium]